MYRATRGAVTSVVLSCTLYLPPRRNNEPAVAEVNTPKAPHTPPDSSTLPQRTTTTTTRGHRC
ncbi:hypothetical protein CERZMDRAFT_91884 [Cercospora zeae-maydis SCOH1-5]|uniref:Uncharacterized protein n=1 Tax=Cercospora zeae-maydis SCOH1-5 TaxID=717836 RepID=A0A6A6EZR9_9PEZI|nr:hypothetical protein CERZMDRAFT_91884 [Cercospora zeae-maydis SCOH1-5]